MGNAFAVAEAATFPKVLMFQVAVSRYSVHLLVKRRKWKIKSDTILCRLKTYLCGVSIWRRWNSGPAFSLTDYNQQCKVSNTMQQVSSGRSLLVEMELDLKSYFNSLAHLNVTVHSAETLWDSHFHFTVPVSITAASAPGFYLALVIKRKSCLNLLEVYVCLLGPGLCVKRLWWLGALLPSLHCECGAAHEWIYSGHYRLWSSTVHTGSTVQ